jgi:hypothetical protein
LANGGRAICAVSEALGAGVRARVGMLYGRGDARAANITQLEIQGDRIGSSRLAGYLGTAAELIGWGPPRNFGTGYRFAQAPPDWAGDNPEEDKVKPLDPHSDSYFHLLYNASREDA